MPQTHMTLADFRKSLKETAPPESLSPAMRALWWDAKGDWRKAHEIAQDIVGTQGSRIHAYLHRKEGDVGNAEYWYRQSESECPADSLESEWEAIVAQLLG